MANPLAIKRQVFESLTETLPDFEVTWGFTKRNPPRSWCYMGDTSFPSSDWETNRSRKYVLSIPIVLNRISARKTPEDAEAEIWGRFDSLVSLFGPGSPIGGVGAVTWMITPRMVGSQPHTEGIEAQGVFELQVTYRA